MRLATVAGKVTLSVAHPLLKGGRMLLACPWKKETLDGADVYDPAIVVFDHLGAGIGQDICISEGREAACPFDPPAPLDAYCAALVDEFFYQPAEPIRSA